MSHTFSDVLAGPILRRVERRNVSVWLALRKPADVTLSLFVGLLPGDTQTAPVATATVPTTAVCTELHLVVVTLTLNPANQLQFDQLYSYDVGLSDNGSQPVGLDALGFLEDGEPDGIKTVALGYQEGLLPGFVLPPSDIADLRLISGSCRLPHNVGADQMVELDGLLSGGGAFHDVAKRPHQMFLTGDQIYADDVAAELLDIIMPVARRLMSGVGPMTEHLPFHHPHQGTEDWPVPVTVEHFPPTRRQRMMVRQVGYSSGSGSSHLFGFGEFAAMYLMVWSNTLWPANWDTTALDRREALALAYKTEWEALYQDYTQNTTMTDRQRKVAGLKIQYHRADKLLPEVWRRIDLHLTPETRMAEWGEEDMGSFLSVAPAPHTTSDIAAPPPQLTPHPEVNEAFASALTPSWYAGGRHMAFQIKGGTLHHDRDLIQIRQLQDFVKGLPKVRRLLANVPTYMTFDDHEVTDDWNITGDWVAGVNALPMGRAVTRNGLLAHGLFQAWGNDPDYFDVNRAGAATPGTEMMDWAKEMFVDISGQPLSAAPAPTPSAELDRLFNIAQSPATPFDQRVRWHFHVGGPGYEVMSLDSRTMRGFPTGDGPPELMTREAIEWQIPADPVYSYGPPVGDTGLTFVIAAAPVLGFPPVEYIVQPLANTMDKMDLPPVGPLSNCTKDYFTGALDHDPEPWSYQEHIFEGVLARLAPYRRVVFISGDVHYGCCLKMDYWSYDSGQPAAPAEHTAFVQATASALKNQPERWKVALFQAGLITRLTSLLGTPRSKIGYHTVGRPEPLNPPPGTQFNRKIQAQNARELAVFDAAALPEGTTQNYGPAFAWRLDTLRDGRADDKRLAGILGVPPMPPDDAVGGALSNPVAERIFWETRHVPSRVTTFFPNSGELRMDAENGAPTGIVWNLLHALRERPEDKVKAYTSIAAPFAPGSAAPVEIPDAATA